MPQAPECDRDGNSGAQPASGTAGFRPEAGASARMTGTSALTD